ncbi:MAG: peptidase [Blautia sp.]|nr:peptidase [Blautia sp.]
MSFVLLRELYQLQIIEGQDFIDDFQIRTTKTRVIKSARGKIYDRNGRLIASNSLAYTLTLEDNGSYESTRQKNLALNAIAYKIIHILWKNGDSVSIGFHIVVGENGGFVYDVEPGFTLSRFKADVFGHPYIDELTEEEKNASAQDMIDFLAGVKGFSIVPTGEDAYTAEELEKYGLPQAFTQQELLEIAKIRYMLNTNSFKKYMPVTVATNVSEESVAALMENQAILTGIDIIEDSTREYVDEISMGPILGYIGQASAEELEQLRTQNPDYTNNAIIGKAGIEQSMELTLQGTDGRETVTVDNLGKVLSIEEDTKVEPIAGNDIQLTIDTEMQAGIYEILKQRVAGILLSKIEASKEFNFDYIIDSGQINIPVYDVYNALVDNCVIDIRLFDRTDASEIEKALYGKFQIKQEQVFAQIRERLTGANPQPFNKESEEIQEYLSYICNNLLRDELQVISIDAVDVGDPIYKAWNDDQSISLKEYLTYAATQHWVNTELFSPEGDYLDSLEVYQALTNYIVDTLKTDYGFSKLLYKYMLKEDTISGSDLCLVLYEQGVLDKDDGSYEALASGAVWPYEFIVNKIFTLDIEPAMLALMPFSASAVVVDIKTGDVVALVSYPGYFNNRLTNDMDTDYFIKLALDQSSPFFNKATQQRTAPGSTMKLLSTIAGMMEGVINDGTYFNCTGSFDFVSPPIACWNTYGHGPIEVTEAIQESCNYFFNMVGFELGKVGDNEFSEEQSLAMLQKYASWVGLDRVTGIEIDEAPPHVSDSLAVPSYMGQGTHMYSTVQLARYALVMATRGTVFKLTLLDKELSPTGAVIEDYPPVIENQISQVPENVWDDIHNGMRRVVQIHSMFDKVNLEVSAKTGTAQIDLYHPDHGLFVGFAPSYDPQYAIACRVENGYSSGNACLVAADIVNYIFNLRDPNTIITGYAAGDSSDTSND